MGKHWDADKGGRDKWIEWMTEIAKECSRVLKPGGHALVWALPRTSHWTATAWEDAGFEVRDCVYHIFGSGFPKSLAIGKAIDKAAGAEREVMGGYKRPDGTDREYKNWNGKHMGVAGEYAERDMVKSTTITAPATPEAKQWDGWGTALKPAVENWLLLRNPLSEKTVAANILKWGVGGININACRVEADKNDKNQRINLIGNAPLSNGFLNNMHPPEETKPHSALMVQGRYPSHLIHDGSDEVVGLFPETESGKLSPENKVKATTGWSGGSQADRVKNIFEPSKGSAARFFYCSKASKRDRDEGLGGFEGKQKHTRNSYGDQGKFDCPDGANRTGNKGTSIAKNTHPTVKTTLLMQYLIKLITPNGRRVIVLDPFMGSGSTGKACVKEDFEFIGIEKDKESFQIAKARIKAEEKKPKQLTFL